MYAWGAIGDFPGTLWGVHGMSVDQEGNFYVAEVDSGRVQKFRPRAGANPAYPGGQARVRSLAVDPGSGSDSGPQCLRSGAVTSIGSDA